MPLPCCPDLREAGCICYSPGIQWMRGVADGGGVLDSSPVGLGIYSQLAKLPVKQPHYNHTHSWKGKHTCNHTYLLNLGAHTHTRALPISPPTVCQGRADKTHPAQSCLLTHSSTWRLPFSLTHIISFIYFLRGMQWIPYWWDGIISNVPNQSRVACTVVVLTIDPCNPNYVLSFHKCINHISLREGLK